MNFLLALKLTILLCFTNDVFATNFSLTSESEKSELTLDEAIKLAIKNDPWLVSNHQMQRSVVSQSISSGRMPDPKVSFDIANLPTDSFNFNQEMMTQAKIGFSQKLPRGDILELRQKELEINASIYPFQRQDREAKIRVLMTELWLSLYKSQQSIKLIENDRALFEQLVDVAQASYSSAIGKTRQQDIIRAQLELTRLDDRLIILKLEKDMAATELFDWINNDHMNNEEININSYQSNLSASSQLPKIPLERMDQLSIINEQKLYELSLNHPLLKIMTKKMAISENQVLQAKQSYKPEWDVRASYAYRENDPRGAEREDFFSIGVTFDIPLFTGNKQDKQVRSVKQQAQSIKTKKWLLAKQMLTRYKKDSKQFLRVKQRLKLYTEHLLPQMQQQAEASLTAYTNDDGDFSEVVRARIAVLNSNIDFLNIKIKELNLRSHLNYFFTNSIDRQLSKMLPGEKS